MNNKNWLKLCSLVLALMLCLTSFGTLVFADGEEAEARTVDAWDGTADTSFLTGENAGKTSYVIDTAEKLAGLAAMVDDASWGTNVNPGVYANVTFYVTVDIDLAGYEWNPIGNHNTTAFGGNLIGCYGNPSCEHTYDAETGVSSCAPAKISNMDITATGGFAAQNKGLIGRKAGGSVMNITMVDPYIETTAQSTGPVVGYSADLPATYANLRIEGGSIKADNGTSGRTSGLVGYAVVANTHINCYSEMVVTVSKDSAAIGGMSGQHTSTPKFINCETKFTVLNPSLANLNKIGGICGGGNMSTGGTFKNCTTDVNITSGANVAKDGNEMIIGGINGFASGSGTQTYMNCTTTGKITIDGNVPEGTQIPGSRQGGIAGVTQNTVNFTNCVSTIDFVYRNIANNNVHCGGIAGQVSDGNTVTARNCYYGGTITANDGKRIGGFFGYMGASSLTMTDCMMDGIVNTRATQNGAVIGRWAMNENTISMTNVIVTGIGANTYGNAYAWVGTAANYNTTATFTATDCFSNAKIPYIGSNDASADQVNSSITINKEANEGTYIGAYAAYKPAVMANQLFWIMNENWDTTGATPVLKIAKDIVNPFAGADLSWFEPTIEGEDENGDFVNVANPVKDYTITTKAQALGVAMLGQLARANALGYTYTVADASILTAAKAQAGVDFGTQNDNIVLKNGDATVMNDTLVVKYQTKGDSIRLIASIGNEEVAAGYEKVGFKLTYGGQTATLVTTTVYQTIVADGDNVNAAAVGYSANSAYLYVVTLEDVPAEAEFIVEAFVVTANGTVTGEAYTFCLNALN